MYKKVENFLLFVKIRSRQKKDTTLAENTPLKKEEGAKRKEFAIT